MICPWLVVKTMNIYELQRATDFITAIGLCIVKSSSRCDRYDFAGPAPPVESDWEAVVNDGWWCLVMVNIGPYLFVMASPCWWCFLMVNIGPCWSVTLGGQWCLLGVGESWPIFRIGYWCLMIVNDGSYWSISCSSRERFGCFRCAEIVDEVGLWIVYHANCNPYDELI